MSQHDIFRYIEEARALMNEHGVERIDDLPSEVLVKFLAKGLERGFLVRDTEDDEDV